MKHLSPLLVLLLATMTMGHATAILLGPTFSDHAVWQRKRPIPIWGQASPGTSITLTFGDQTVSTVASSEGSWRVNFPPQEAGGPFTLEVEAGETRIRITDILIGDVWLASGQSNMGWTIGNGVTNQEQTIATATFDGIRQLKILEVASSTPESSATTSGWLVCDPETVRSFSAVAYYFAREIHLHTGVPIGIINSSWGGSSIEAWMSPEAMGDLPHLDGPEIPEVLRGEVSLRDFNAVNDQRIQEIATLVSTSHQALAAGVLEPGFDDKSGSTGSLPSWRELSHSIIWLRHAIEVPAIPKGEIEIKLGHSQSFGSIYLNDELLLDVENAPLVVRLPGSKLRLGKNELVVRLANKWFPPFLMGDTAQAGLRSFDGELSIPLTEGWKRYENLEPPLPSYYPLQTVPHALFNAMIHPLIDGEFTGVIWYQGENNGNNGLEYRALFPAMINDWRTQLNRPDLPFLWVQLANHGEPSSHQNFGWPFLREAQAHALSLPTTGMAVAVDVGDAIDIHPKNKTAVGHRLALQARRVAYHEPIVADGPTLQRAVFRTDFIEIHFDQADGLHVPENAPIDGFVVAGSDHVFLPATAQIEGSLVRLRCDAVPNPVSVRYGWAQNPPVNLYNDKDLPASPFRTDSWAPDPQ